MPKKKGDDNSINYELEFLRMENERLKYQLENIKHKNDPNMEKDIQNLVQISIKMKYLLDRCRSELMMPVDLGREIDKVIKEIEYYN